MGEVGAGEADDIQVVGPVEFCGEGIDGGEVLVSFFRLTNRFIITSGNKGDGDSHAGN